MQAEAALQRTATDVQGLAAEAAAVLWVVVLQALPACLFLM
jgi:hypothetical protein